MRTRVQPGARKLWGLHLGDLPLRHLTWSVGVSLLGVTTARLLTSFMHIIVARRLDVVGYGQYTAVFAIFTMVAVVASFGLDTWILRAGARDRERIAETIGDVLLIKAGLALIWIVVLAVTAAFFPDSLYTSPLAFLATLGLIFESISLTAYSALRALMRNTISSALQCIGAVVTLGLMLMAWQPDKAVGWFVEIRMLSAVAIAFSSLFIVHRLVGAHLSLKRIPGILRESWSFLVSDVLSNIYLKADLAMVVLLLGETAAGLYSPALNIVNATFLVPNIVYMVMLPVLSRPDVQRGELRRLVVVMLLGLVPYGLLLWAGLFWGAPWLIGTVYGARYGTSAVILAITSAIPLVKALSFILTTIIIARERQHSRAILQTCIATATVVANLVIIPRFGIIGAAYVYLVIECALTIGYAGIVWSIWKQTYADSHR